MTTRLPLSLQKPAPIRNESGQFVSRHRIACLNKTREMRKALGLPPHPALGGGV